MSLIKPSTALTLALFSIMESQYVSALAVSDSQNSPSNAYTTEPRKHQLEEVIVTAQKREENLQDVPISIQAFSGDMLGSRGISDQSELQQIVPSLDVGNQVGYTTFFMRGVGTDAYLTADPSIASYIDGIYFPFAQGLVQDFGAVERIEVLKGPQGTLFGRNAVGGAISVVTKSPDTDSVWGNIDTSYARFNTTKTRIFVNVPLMDNMAFSLSGLYNESDNYFSGTVGGKDIPVERSKGIRLKYKWDVTSDLSLSFAALKLEADGANSILQLNRHPNALGAALGIEPQEGYDIDLSSRTFQSVDNTVFYGDAYFTGRYFDIKVLGSDQYIDTSGRLDFDGSSAPLVTVDSRKQFGDIQTAEIQFLSNEDSWGSSWFTWIAGAYYFKGLQGFDPADISVAGLQSQPGSELLGLTLPTQLVNTITDTLAVFGISDPTQITVRLQSPVSTESVSAFAQTTFDISEWFSLTLGLRWQSEERSVEKSTASLVLPTGNVVELFDFKGAVDSDGNAVEPRNITESLKPKISFDFRPFGEDTLVYLSYQEAIKAATFNAVNIYTEPRYVEPEEIEAYEVGIKTSLFDGAVRFNAAYFDYSITNLQVQFVSLLAGGAVTFENAEKTASKGFDFDTSILLFPRWINDLVLSGGAAYIDSKFIEFTNGTGYDGESGIYSEGNDYSGNTTQRSPEYTATASLVKTWNTNMGEFVLGGDMYYNSGFFYASANTPQSEQESYKIYGARVEYYNPDIGLRLSAFGKNLSNTDYTAGNFGTDFGTLVTVAPPRTYGVRIKYDF